MIRHKNGKNKPLYIGGQKYDGTKTVVVELAPDKSEYKNYFLTYIAGYDEYKLVFCPTSLEEMTPLETYIYSDEDCTQEIAVVTEVNEENNNVKVLYPNGLQSVFLYNNSKQTNGLVDYQTMVDYVAEHSGSGEIEQPLYLKRSKTSAWQQFNGSESVNFEVLAAFNLLSNERGEIEYIDETTVSYSKPFVLFSVGSDFETLNISNGKCKFYLQFGNTDSNEYTYQYDCFITIDVYNNYYTAIVDGLTLIDKHFGDRYLFKIQDYIRLYKANNRYYICMLPLNNTTRKFNVYGNVAIKIEKTYIENEDFDNLTFLKNTTFLQTTPSADNNHILYEALGAVWLEPHEVKEALREVDYPVGDLGQKKFIPSTVGNVSFGAWLLNGLLIQPSLMVNVLIDCLYYLGNPNLDGNFLNNFAGLTNFDKIKLENKELNDCYMNITSKAINVGIFKPTVGNNFLLNSQNVEYVCGEIDLSLVDPDHDLDFFMGGNVKYAKIKNFPRAGVFPNKIFKTWENISLSSFDALIEDVQIFGDLWDLHVSETQIDRLVSESILFSSRESFIYECWDTHSVNIIVDNDLGT